MMMACRELMMGYTLEDDPDDESDDDDDFAERDEDDEDSNDDGEEEEDGDVETWQVASSRRLSWSFR